MDGSNVQNPTQVEGGTSAENAQVENENIQAAVTEDTLYDALGWLKLNTKETPKVTVLEESQPETSKTESTEEPEIESEPAKTPDEIYQELVAEFAPNVPLYSQNQPQQQYQQQYQQPQQQYQSETQTREQDSNTLPVPPDWDEMDEFEKANYVRQMQGMQVMLQAALAPAYQFIQQQQEEIQKQQQEIEARERNQAFLNASAPSHKLMDSYVPGFAQLGAKAQQNEESLSIVEKAIFGAYVGLRNQLLEACYMQNPQSVFNPRIHVEVAKEIAPQIQDLAKVMNWQGVQSQNNTQPQLTEAQKKQMQHEMHVISSNAVPANTKSNFSKAYEAKDVDGMLDAIFS